MSPFFGFSRTSRSPLNGSEYTGYCGAFMCSMWWADSFKSAYWLPYEVSPMNGPVLMTSHSRFSGRLGEIVWKLNYA